MNIEIFFIKKFKNNLDDKGKLDQDCIIDDIVFIYTLWGNDFVPKMRSIDRSYDRDRVFEFLYKKSIISNNGYII